MVPKLIIHADAPIRTQEIEKIIIQNNLSKAHPNLLWFGEEDKVGIEQSRKVIEHLNLKPYQGDRQAVVMVSAENLTLEAQNALLKTLEEPPGDSLILLGISSEDQLLATILSRCHLIHLKGSTTTDKNVAEKYRKKIEELIESSYEKRFQYIEKLENREEFLHHLVLYFRAVLTQSTFPHSMWEAKIITEFLKDLIEAERWTKQNVNIRAILEYLMLQMPSNTSSTS